MIARRTLLTLSLALPGCTLIDQRTFDPAAGQRPELPKPPIVPAAAPEYGPPPLFTVQLPIAGDLRADITKPVAAARARKADVSFDVVEITPDAGADVGSDAATVARAIEAQGVAPARVRLAVRPTAAARREVRVYIR